MKRRKLLTLIGGAAVCSLAWPLAASLHWPLGARAQQNQRVRRIGVLMGLKADDPEGQARLAAFAQGLQQAGWAVGQNVRIEYYWGGGDAELMRKQAAELVARAPDVIMAHSSAAVAPLLQQTRTIPIVFTLVADPVGAGYVNSLAKPGGNVTGFTNFEYSIGGKWLDLLKEIAPNVARVAVLRESFVASGPGQFGAIQSAAQLQRLELRPIDLRDAGEIERDITAFGQEPNGGLIVTGSPAATVHRQLINALARRHQLPIVFNSRFYVASGGLISYGPDFIDQFRRAAGYVDRILKGEKPSELPVQTPTKYELVINLKAAKEIGLVIPPTVISRADDVLE
jgi:putative tryptophan/tyrosine transport system substrate-binding protein